MRINCIYDYYTLLNKIKKEGLDVNDTYELVCEKLNFGFRTTKDLKEMLDITNEFEHEFVEAISKFDEKVIGNYIAKEYFLLIPSVKKAVSKIKFDCNETRRAVINFPEEHCFQTIQFILRENTVNIVCYMRSCNAIKNLRNDAWICSFLGDVFKHELAKIIDDVDSLPYHFNNVTMFFGSLHCYKEELKHVL